METKPANPPNPSNPTNPSNPSNLVNPWRKLEDRFVYENPWITVHEHKVVQPGGDDGIYGVVHFKHKAIGILPIEENGDTHLVGQYRYPLDIFSWEIPEGGCPDNEDPLAAAKRELEEETGLTATEWSELGGAHLSNSVSDEVAILYVAKGLTAGQACPDPDEHLSQKRLPFKDALDMVHKGEITDSMSVIAILKYALMSQEKYA